MPSSTTRAYAIGIVMLTAAAAASCERTPAKAVAASVEVHTYTVRGIVSLVPSKENPLAEFVVRHEPIPTFVGENGTIGMNAMEMPFPLKPGVSLEGIRLGNKIELTFEVDYDTAKKRPVNYRAVAVKVLPQETRLVFGEGQGAGHHH